MWYVLHSLNQLTWCYLPRQLVRSIPRLSASSHHLLGKISTMGTFFCMFIVKMADHDGIHRCLVEKNVPIALNLPSRWRDGWCWESRDRALAVYVIYLPRYSLFTNNILDQSVSVDISLGSNECTLHNVSS